MPSLYMLDTNTVSVVVKKQSTLAVERIERLDLSEACISVITEGELLFGLARKPEATQLAIAVHEFLARAKILNWDSRAAATYADLRSKLERVGKPIGPLDLLIAAHALSQRATLISNDRAFRMVPDLLVEDWTLR